jgi:hypothetical protein
MVKNFTVLMFLAKHVLGSNEMSTKHLFQNFNEHRKFIQRLLGKPQRKMQSGRIY